MLLIIISLFKLHGDSVSHYTYSSLYLLLMAIDLRQLADEFLILVFLVLLVHLMSNHIET